MRKKILLALTGLLVSLVLAEIGLRLAGIKPHRNRDYTFRSIPRNCYIPDSLLGGKLGEGSFTSVVNEKLSYRATHALTGNDVTRKIYNTSPDSSLPRIDFHGCSFTYGMGVDDTDTYPYLYALSNPTWQVRNYGCAGYSTLEALLILQRQKAQSDLPKVVIINYLDFHDDRNAGSSEWREGLQEGYLMNNGSSLSAEYSQNLNSCRFPFAHLVNNKAEITWFNIRNIYDRFLGRDQFALIYTLEKVANQSRYNNGAPVATTKALLLQIQKLCNENKVRLIVTTMSTSAQTTGIQKFLTENHIRWVDISVDFSNNLYTNYPLDGHPSPTAHRIFAGKLINANIIAE